MSIFLKREWLFELVVVLLIWGVASSALAAGVGSGGRLPWDSPLGSLRTSMQNVVGPALVVIGIIMTFGAVMFSGEISEFGRRGPALVGGGAGIIGASAILNMFSSGGLLP